jgi:hypothetical protein
MNNSYFHKYRKYKHKYILYKQHGGVITNTEGTTYINIRDWVMNKLRTYPEKQPDDHDFINSLIKDCGNGTVDTTQLLNKFHDHLYDITHDKVTLSDVIDHVSNYVANLVADAIDILKNLFKVNVNNDDLTTEEHHELNELMWGNTYNYTPILNKIIGRSFGDKIKRYYDLLTIEKPPDSCNVLLCTNEKTHTTGSLSFCDDHLYILILQTVRHCSSTQSDWMLCRLLCMLTIRDNIIPSSALNILNWNIDGHLGCIQSNVKQLLQNNYSYDIIIRDKLVHVKSYYNNIFKDCLHRNIEVNKTILSQHIQDLINNGHLYDDLKSIYDNQFGSKLQFVKMKKMYGATVSFIDGKTVELIDIANICSRDFKIRYSRADDRIGTVRIPQNSIVITKGLSISCYVNVMLSDLEYVDETIYTPTQPGDDLLQKYVINDHMSEHLNIYAKGNIETNMFDFMMSVCKVNLDNKIPFESLNIHKSRTIHIEPFSRNLTHDLKFDWRTSAW